MDPEAVAIILKHRPDLAEKLSLPYKHLQSLQELFNQESGASRNISYHIASIDILKNLCSNLHKFIILFFKFN